MDEKTNKLQVNSSINKLDYNSVKTSYLNLINLKKEIDKELNNLKEKVSNSDISEFFLINKIYPKFSVNDFNKIPTHFLSLNQGVISKAYKASKDNKHEIKGIYKFLEKNGLSMELSKSISWKPIKVTKEGNN